MSDAQSWTTAIAEVQDDDVIVRGYRLSDLVGTVTFVDAIFLVHTGELPSPAKRAMLDAIFVSLIEHGISPSTIITRMLASCGTPSQAAVAGGVLSIADWHGGSGEQLSRVLSEIVTAAQESGRVDDEALERHTRQLVADYQARRLRFAGFGHPQHSDGDPRAVALLELADELGVSGTYVRAVRGLEAEIERSRGRRLPLNVTGALAALLQDLGFSWQAIRGLVIAARSAGLVAHVVEELEQGGRWRHASEDEVAYTGPHDRTLPEPVA